jgi:tetratricopeptide (TPR) repeat protein
MAVPPPQQQSTVYAELYKRHQDAAANQNLSDEEANRSFNAAQQALKQQQQATAGAAGGAGQPGQAGAAPGGAAPGAAAPGAAAPGGAAAGGAAAGAATPGGAAPSDANIDYAKRGEQILKEAQKNKKAGVAKKPEPVKVPSLSSGVKGKGLAELLKQAEDEMKAGKFTKALDDYDKADQVAPNNPMIKLGRANAELGASYYARADAHLREALSKNPELLAGQYDLANMLGEQRLQTLVRDLKEIANKEQGESRPLFLLAYIAYNTGNEQMAEGYVDLADKRSGGKDPFYKLLRDNWTLPGGAAGAAAGSATTQPANK